MVYKITRGIIAIAISLSLTYGVGTAASQCCGDIINICIPSGVRSPMMPTIDAHCQPSLSHHLNRHRSADDSAGSARIDLNDHTTCCSARPWTPIGFTAYPVQSQPSSPWFEAANKTFTKAGEYKTIALTYNLYALYRQTIPIFLVTKSIIC